MKKIIYLFLFFMHAISWQVHGSLAQSLTDLKDELLNLKNTLEAPSLASFPTKKPLRPEEQQAVRMVRVVPMAFNQKTKEWSVLLGHDPGKFWSDFSISSLMFKDDPATLANTAIETNTKGAYKNLDLSQAVVRKTLNNDIVYFVPVEFISGSYLYNPSST